MSFVATLSGSAVGIVKIALSVDGPTMREIYLGRKMRRHRRLTRQSYRTLVYVRAGYIAFDATSGSSYCCSAPQNNLSTGRYNHLLAHAHYSLNFWHVTREQFRTLWFSLASYHTHLVALDIPSASGASEASDIQPRTEEFPSDNLHAMVSSSAVDL